ncbi:MAG TPA: hypothetical protein PK313_00525 [Myxococcota bacterium]|nr:hypothetical protein [Myxococcota bacterium]
MKALLGACVAVTALLLAPPTASARDYGPDLGAFYRTCTPGQACQRLDTAGFEDYARQIGSALAPAIGPIHSLGGHGFDVSLTTGLSTVHRDRDYWTPDGAGRPGVASGPGDLFVTSQIGVRKGLPYGLRLGGTVTHLYDSNLWGIGLELGWAFVDGYKWAPDIGIVASVGTLLGSDDFLMIQVSPALVLSKRFAVAGLFHLAPYLAYNVLYVNASTHLTATSRGGTDPVLFAFEPRHVVRHRGVLGLEMLASWVVVGAEMTVDFDDARRTYAIKVGAQF